MKFSRVKWLKYWAYCQNLKFIFCRNTRQIFTNFGTEHSWVMRIQVCRSMYGFNKKKCLDIWIIQTADWNINKEIKRLIISYCYFFSMVYFSCGGARPWTPSIASRMPYDATSVRPLSPSSLWRLPHISMWSLFGKTSLWLIHRTLHSALEMRGTTVKCPTHSISHCTQRCQQCRIPFCSLSVSSSKNKRHQKKGHFEKIFRISKNLLNKI